MKLVIDIPEGHYNSIVSGHDIEIYYGEHFVTKDSWASELIRKGTPLEQEPFKPMVEIDLYSVIKQKYIEREVLDRIREQIKSHLRGVEITLEVLVENDPLRPKMEGAKDTLEECLELINKAETEAEDGNDRNN